MLTYPRRALTRLAAGARALGALPRRHRAFTVVLVVAAALRGVTMLGYPPALLYWYDSFTYLDNAVHLQPSRTTRRSCGWSTRCCPTRCSSCSSFPLSPY